MAKVAEIVKGHWDIKGLAQDLKAQRWRITEGPTKGGGVRIDRMDFVASYGRIEDLAKALLTEEERAEAEAADTLPEVLDDVTREYMEVLGEAVGEEMGEHVYGTFEEGDAFIGQYEDGDYAALVEAGFDIELERGDEERLRRAGVGLEGAGPSMGAAQPGVAAAFVRGETGGQAGSLYIHGDRIYSYGPHFPVAERRPGGAIAITSRKSPSVTTSKHITFVRRAAEDAGAPVEAADLAPEA